MKTANYLVASILLAMGCDSFTELKGEPDDLPPGGKAESPVNWVDHGQVAFDDDALGTLGRHAPVHSWSFELTAGADVAFETLSAGEETPDTVLHLIEVSDRGRQYAAPPDDDGGEGTFSQLYTTLAAGHYEIVVTGYWYSEEGAFAIRSKCRGDGCEPVVVADTCSALDVASGDNPCTGAGPLVSSTTRRWPSTPRSLGTSPISGPETRYRAPSRRYTSPTVSERPACPTSST